MGIETAILVGLSAASAISTIKQGEAEAEAVVDQANIDARNKSKETRAKASRAKVSFLNSGLTLEGTPLNAITGIFDSGIQDINLITGNANKRAKNIMTSARTEAIMGLAQTGISAGMGAMGGGGLNGATGGGFNSMFSGSTLANNETVRTLSTGQSGFVGALPQ